MNQIILTATTREDLVVDIVEKVLHGIEPILKAHQQKHIIDKKEYWTIAETASVLKVSKVTIHDYVNRGILKKYRIGSRILFKSAEVLASIQSIDTKNSGL